MRPLGAHRLAWLTNGLYHAHGAAASQVAVLTVASTPPIGEYGKQKVHYLTELSIENKRQYCAQHGFELVVAQNLGHGRTARWDKVLLLRRVLAQYEWVHWVDLDTLFMNMKRSPLEFLDKECVATASPRAATAH